MYTRAKSTCKSIFHPLTKEGLYSLASPSPLTLLSLPVYCTLFFQSAVQRAGGPPAGAGQAVLESVFDDLLWKIYQDGQAGTALLSAVKESQRKQILAPAALRALAVRQHKRDKV